MAITNNEEIILEILALQKDEWIGRRFITQSLVSRGKDTTSVAKALAGLVKKELVIRKKKESVKGKPVFYKIRPAAVKLVAILEELP